MGQPWTADAIPDLSGKYVVVTGANSGIGFEAARGLARRGAHVVLACRNPTKAEEALAAIRGQAPGATLEVMPLDLASLASIRSFAGELQRRYRRLDVLCNNAGIMAIPLARTEDGFEMQIGTNHLGHFALTGLLLPALLSTPHSRVVTVSSGAHRIGSIRLDDLNWRNGYRKWLAYGQSKLANLLFSYELQRRFDAVRSNTISVACHPGYAATNLQGVGPRLQGSSAMQRLMEIGNRLAAQSASMGALPTLYAATAADVAGGDFIGPDGIGQTWGYPKKVRSNRRSHDRQVAARLWDLSQELTGVTYRF